MAFRYKLTSVQRGRLESLAILTYPLSRSCRSGLISGTERTDEISNPFARSHIFLPHSGNKRKTDKMDLG